MDCWCVHKPGVSPSGKGREEDIKRRVEQLKQEIEETKSDYEKEKLQDRVAKLSDGVAVLKVRVSGNHCSYCNRSAALGWRIQ